MSADVIPFPGGSAKQESTGADPMAEYVREHLQERAKRQPPLSNVELIQLRQLLASFNDPAGGSYIHRKHMLDKGWP
jgi:hypothetical protein